MGPSCYPFFLFYFFFLRRGVCLKQCCINALCGLCLSVSAVSESVFLLSSTTFAVCVRSVCVHSLCECCLCVCVCVCVLSVRVRALSVFSLCVYRVSLCECCLCVCVCFSFAQRQREKHCTFLSSNTLCHYSTSYIRNKKQLRDKEKEIKNKEEINKHWAVGLQVLYTLNWVSAQEHITQKLH